MSEIPVAETAGKWGVSWHFPSGPSEGLFETREEAVRFIAEMPRESTETMHVLFGESWFPGVYVDAIIEEINEDFYNEADVDCEPYLDDHIVTSMEAFREDLEQSILAVFKRHLKPVDLWSEDCELSGDGAREELGEVTYERD